MNDKDFDLEALLKRAGTMPTPLPDEGWVERLERKLLGRADGKGAPGGAVVVSIEDLSVRRDSRLRRAGATYVMSGIAASIAVVVLAVGMVTGGDAAGAGVRIDLASGTTVEFPDGRIVDATDNMEVPDGSIIRVSADGFAIIDGESFEGGEVIRVDDGDLVIIDDGAPDDGSTTSTAPEGGLPVDGPAEGDASGDVVIGTTPSTKPGATSTTKPSTVISSPGGDSTTTAPACVSDSNLEFSAPYATWVSSETGPKMAAKFVWSKYLGCGAFATYKILCTAPGQGEPGVVGDKFFGTVVAAISSKTTIEQIVNPLGDALEYRCVIAAVTSLHQFLAGSSVITVKPGTAPPTTTTPTTAPPSTTTTTPPVTTLSLEVTVGETQTTFNWTQYTGEGAWFEYKLICSAYPAEPTWSWPLPGGVIVGFVISDSVGTTAKILNNTALNHNCRVVAINSEGVLLAQSNVVHVTIIV